jgi:hypothetical protein
VHWSRFASNGWGASWRRYKEKTLATLGGCVCVRQERASQECGCCCERVREHTRTPQSSEKRERRRRGDLCPVLLDLTGLSPRWWLEAQICLVWLQTWWAWSLLWVLRFSYTVWNLDQWRFRFKSGFVSLDCCYFSTEQFWETNSLGRPTVSDWADFLSVWWEHICLLVYQVSCCLDMWFKSSLLIGEEDRNYDISALLYLIFYGCCCCCRWTTRKSVL